MAINSSLADGKIKFGIDADGNYGYIKDGADSVTPFKSGANIMKFQVTTSKDQTNSMHIGIDTSRANSIEISGNIFSYHTIWAKLYINSTLLSQTGNTDNSGAEIQSAISKVIDVSSVNSVLIKLDSHAGWANAYSRFEGTIEFT